MVLENRIAGILAGRFKGYRHNTSIYRFASVLNKNQNIASWQYGTEPYSVVELVVHGRVNRHKHDCVRNQEG